MADFGLWWWLQEALLRDGVVKDPDFVRGTLLPKMKVSELVVVRNHHGRPGEVYQPYE